MICLGLQALVVELFDDAKYNENVLRHNDWQSLQNDLNNIHHYRIRWGLKFSFEKCVMLSVTRKTIPTDFLLYYQQYNSSPGAMYEGSWCFCYQWFVLEFSYKCSSIQMWQYGGMLTRSVGYKAPINVTSYLQAYCSTVWSMKCNHYNPFNGQARKRYNTVYRIIPM